MALSCADRRYLLITLTTRWQNSIGCSPDRPVEMVVNYPIHKWAYQSDNVTRSAVADENFG